MADNHSVYKNGAKEIAWQQGYALTFMAKYNEREGNSCHIHCSLWDEKGSLFPAADGHGLSTLGRQFVAGQIAAGRELTAFLAPNVNSYKRYAAGSFAPTTLVWGTDNRTCALRVVGHGQSMRLENRSPGADCNPYLAFAAIIAAGLHGIDNELELEDEYNGNAYEAEGKPRLPDDAARGGRPARGLGDRPRGVRRRGRGALPALRPHRAGRLRRRGHRLGALPGLRAAVIAGH